MAAAPALSTALVEQSGFPPGYFVIRCVAGDRALDVAGASRADGAELLLAPEKETSLVESLRDAEADSQVFFLDAAGALCSRASGHAVDVQDGQLVLRHRRPISYPYPNKHAHPLPRWTYTAKSGEISAHFACDPTFPAPGQGSDAWRARRYVLAAVPRRRPLGMFDAASAFFAGALANPAAVFARPASSAGGQARPDEVFDGRIDLRDEDVDEADRGAEHEGDDSPELRRPVRVIVLERDDARPVSAQAQQRRAWNILALRKTHARTGGL